MTAREARLLASLSSPSANVGRLCRGADLAVVRRLMRAGLAAPDPVDRASASPRWFRRTPAGDAVLLVAPESHR